MEEICRTSCFWQLLGDPSMAALTPSIWTLQSASHVILVNAEGFSVRYFRHQRKMSRPRMKTRFDSYRSFHLPMLPHMIQVGPTMFGKLSNRIFQIKR